MRKISALAAGLSLSLASALLILSLAPVLAADGTANCGGFTKVKYAASATRCVCQDGVGCISYFADGTTSEATCKEANGGPTIEEGPVN